jgi:hypothetical protein
MEAVDANVAVAALPVVLLVSVPTTFAASAAVAADCAVISPIQPGAGARDAQQCNRDGRAPLLTESGEDGSEFSVFPSRLLPFVVSGGTDLHRPHYGGCVKMRATGLAGLTESRMRFSKGCE